jgi:predicted nucleic acid-binding protein
VTRKWVVNASPLIVLGKISQIELLVKLADTLVVPRAVANEIEQGAQNDPAKKWLAQNVSELIVETPPLNTVVANWDLGDGESHVISWALAYSDYEAIVDDLAARKCAKTLSIPVRGTLGVVLLARKTGLIQKIDPILEDISTAGLRIDSNLLEYIRSLAGE